MTIRETSKNGVCILETTGRIDFTTRKEIQNAMKSAIGSEPRHIVFNLKEVTFIDSAGLGLLLLASKDCQISNVRFSLCHPEDYVKDVLTLANIKKQIPIFDSLENALSN